MGWKGKVIGFLLGLLTARPQFMMPGLNPGPPLPLGTVRGGPGVSAGSDADVGGRSAASLVTTRLFIAPRFARSSPGADVAGGHFSAGAGPARTSAR